MSQTRESTGFLADKYAAYEVALRQLLGQLDRDSEAYHQTLVYQQRLLENIADARRHGDHDQIEAERSVIVEQLNRLTLKVLDRPFNEIYERVIASARPATGANAGAAPSPKPRPADPAQPKPRRGQAIMVFILCEVIAIGLGFFVNDVIALLFFDGSDNVASGIVRVVIFPLAGLYVGFRLARRLWEGGE